MASVISQSIHENYLPVVLILMALLLFILSSEQNIRVARPGIFLIMDIIANLLMLIVVYMHSVILLDSIHPSMIVTVVHIGVCCITLLSVFNMIFVLGLYFSRTVIRLKQELYCKVKFLLTRIGARKPKGYVILSYQKDIEMGFCNGECAICLMEFEKGDKCALLDKCEHTFHHLCLYQCLAISTRCPICRQSTEACTNEVELNASAS